MREAKAKRKQGGYNNIIKHKHAMHSSTPTLLQPCWSEIAKREGGREGKERGKRVMAHCGLATPHFTICHNGHICCFLRSSFTRLESLNKNWSGK